MGHDVVVGVLIDHGANIDEISGSRTALHWAVLYGHLATVRLLLERGAKIETRGYTPLCDASDIHNKTIVKMLFEHADAEAKDNWGNTPLHYAIISLDYHGDESIIQLLLQRGANIESRNAKGTTPLLCAISYRRYDTAQLLLEKGANIEERDKEGMTPLLYSSGDHNGDIVQLLLKKGANVMSWDCNSYTPLFVVASYGSHSIVKILLEELGADML